MADIINIDGTEREKEGYMVNTGFRWRLDGTSGEGYYHPKDGDRSLKLKADFNSNGMITNIEIKHEIICDIRGRLISEYQWIINIDKKCAEVLFGLIGKIQS